MNTTDTKNVTVKEFYRYQTQERVDHTNILVRSGHLGMQYACDMCCKMEANTVNKYNTFAGQKKLRSEKYQVLSDAVAAGESVKNLGKRVILPSSFVQGPRYKQQQFQDSMAIVREYGKPDLFPTMTANPNWPEIQKSLHDDETAKDRPDIVIRVFRLKVLQLIDLIVKKEVFGKVASLIWVIEFQKRGLPHAHMLIILDHKWKLRCAEHIDEIIQAEIPEDPELREIILKHNVHGPCQGNTKLAKGKPCRKKKNYKNPELCSKNYPKEFTKETVMNLEGFPSYQRRKKQLHEYPEHVQKQLTKYSTDAFGKKHQLIIDNRWIVPYNVHLSKLFDCHLNVEYCGTIGAIKYLYK